jgi:hypothetical protein
MEPHRPLITEVSKKAAVAGAWFVCITTYEKCEGANVYAKIHTQSVEKYEKKRREESEKDAQSQYLRLLNRTQRREEGTGDVRGEAKTD